MYQLVNPLCEFRIKRSSIGGSLLLKIYNTKKEIRMINRYRLENIKRSIENEQESDMSEAMIELQQVVYELGGTRNIFQMSPGATALYLTILLELARE